MSETLVQVRLDEINSQELLRIKSALAADGIKMSDAALANLLVSRGFPSVIEQFKEILSKSAPEPKPTKKSK